MGKRSLHLRAKTKTKLKSKLQIKVVWNNGEREFGGMNLANENCYNVTFENFQSNSLLRIFM